MNSNAIVTNTHTSAVSGIIAALITVPTLRVRSPGCLNDKDRARIRPHSSDEIEIALFGLVSFLQH